MIVGPTYSSRDSSLPAQERQSRDNQAKFNLRFPALLKASVVDEAACGLDRKVFKKMGHNEAICKINEFAMKGMFLPLPLAPLALTKFCVVRLGEIDEAEQFFALTLQKYQPVDLSSPYVRTLYSELMWVYIGKKVRDTKRLLELVKQCPCTETYSALASHYNRSQQPEKTILLHENWPVGIHKDGTSYRYYAYALKDVSKDTKQVQAFYENTRRENPELMQDVYFFVDYIKLGKRSDKIAISPDELHDIEALFNEFSEYRYDDKRFRELLRACFDAKRYDKAKAYFTPCLNEPWLGRKTRELIVTRMAEESLKESIDLYGRLLPTHTGADFTKASFVLDFHTNILSSHGAQEYGSEPLAFIELRLWHLYSVLLSPNNFKKGDQQEVKVLLIPGKGKNHDLKKLIEVFIKARFGWDCFKYNEAKRNSGIIQLRLPLNMLLKVHEATPEHIFPEKALQ